MSKELKKLNGIGAQKIHETTHIAKTHIEAILNREFDGLNSVQLSGFISILEREYNIDLSDIKNDAILYYNENIPDTPEEKNIKILSSPKKNSLSMTFYAGVLVVVVAIFLYFSLIQDDTLSEVVIVDNSTVKATAKSVEPEPQVEEIKSIKPSTQEKSEKVEKKETIKVEKVEKVHKVEKTKNIEKVDSKILPIKIIPKHEVWIGYIDLKTYKRYQKTFRKELTLDSDKNWLFVFGHGYINIEIDGVDKEYRNPKNVRFSYINSQLKEITLDEFKDLNKGSRW